eukprot:m.154579 g.154579  ORF g.154579 m.154579 type:complete len:173 (+) comp15084_c0_seq9:186-704(+)
MSASESNQIADIKRFEASCKDILRELRQEGSSVHRTQATCFIAFGLFTSIIGVIVYLDVLRDNCSFSTFINRRPILSTVLGFLSYKVGTLVTPKHWMDADTTAIRLQRVLEKFGLHNDKEGRLTVTAQTAERIRNKEIHSYVPEASRYQCTYLRRRSNFTGDRQKFLVSSVD